MGNRFSEIMNAKWCKVCSANVIDGQPHPDEAAHFAAQEAEAKAVLAQEATAAKLSAGSTLIPVSSNDMLKHIAMPESPETLCGRLITDKYRPSTTDLVCDICANLASAASFLVNSEGLLDDVKERESKFATNYTRDGYKIDDDGFTVVTSESEADNDIEYSFFTYERFANSVEFDIEVGEPSEEPTDEIVYLGSVEEDEPIQFTAHWLEEDNEEPLFLPNDEL